MAQKKVINYNACRPLIVAAHNDGNKKAITREMFVGANIDTGYFEMWKSDVAKLQKAVWEYVALKFNAKCDDTIKPEVVQAARNRIYPAWKEILSDGEENRNTRQLHVSESDVEDLVGFAWNFMDSGRGTVQCQVGANVFRKKVESLLGCAIAKNAVLTDADRDLIKTYNALQARIKSCGDKIVELDGAIKEWQKMAAKLKPEEAQFREFIDGKIAEIETEKAETTKAQGKAEIELKKCAKDAQAALKKIKLAK